MDQKCVWRGGTTISTVDVGTGNCTIFWWQLYHIKWKKRITCAGATGTFNIILSNRGVVPSSYRIQSLWNVSKILWFTSFWESSITKNIWKHRMTSMGDSEKLIPNHNQSSTASLVVISWLSYTWSKPQSVWSRISVCVRISTNTRGVLMVQSSIELAKWCWNAMLESLK